jgi:hypothetical protein
LKDLFEGTMLDKLLASLTKKQRPSPVFGKRPCFFLCKDWSRHDLFDHDANNKDNDKE